jgi:hypothetical protein
VSGQGFRGIQQFLDLGAHGGRRQVGADVH